MEAPWKAIYADIPATLDYGTRTMSGTVLGMASLHATMPALRFFGRTVSYRTLAAEIERTAKAFHAMGVKPGTRVMICLPNIPQAIYCLYALNRIGAVAAMVHPLSAIGELEYYAKEISSSIAVTLDQFYPKFKEILSQQGCRIEKLVVARISDELPFWEAPFYRMAEQRKFEHIHKDGRVTLWKDFIRRGRTVTEYAVDKDPLSEAVVLFTGGTSGVSKGAMLSDLNFNALALQTAAMSHECLVGKSMLAAMPVFHGFGLGVCTHTMLSTGGSSILVPRFNVKTYALLIKKFRPNFIAGVPTLFEAVLKTRELDGVELSCLKGVFCGGDTLPVQLKERFDKFLQEHGANVRIREGYGATECVAASCLTPYNREIKGSIGIPYPDTFYKICRPDTLEELPSGTPGEICISGPSVMLGYVGRPEEDAITLEKDGDGTVWLHTGDLGEMDAEGFVYFRDRIKRMIITSGYNVYPNQLEMILDSHPAVKESCVVGIPDPYKIQKVKAYVVLADPEADPEAARRDIMTHCRREIAKYALPSAIVFLPQLPRTPLGKVAVKVLGQG